MLETISSFFKNRREGRKLTFDLPLIFEPNFETKDQVVRGITRIPYKEVKSGGLSYFSEGGRSTLVPPQYDHQEIEAIFDVEGYFARATRAKIALFSKEGWDFVGPQEDRVKYIKTRLEQIERASRVPTFDLMTKIARNLIVHSNAYLLKVRKTEASGGRERKDGEITIKPVAGYFSLPPEGMFPEIDKFGNIIGWQLVLPTGTKKFAKRDIVHFYINKKDGYPLGVPSIISGLDDIHALRHIEESVEVLIRKNLFPLMLFQVGTPEMPAGVNPDGTNEIDVLYERISDMPTEGALVVPERYDVKAIGSEGRAMRVEGYINHFKERVFADCDVSSVDMGIGGTSNRSTASSMSRNLVDIVKHVQLTIQSFFQTEIISELLLESTFEQGSLFDPENKVSLKFKEIDTELKTSKENHIANLFNNNLLTFSEARSQMGLEPLSEEEEKGLHWNKFGREQALIGSVDELSGKGAPSAINSSDKPSNQHGQRSAPKTNRDSFNSKTKINQNNPIMMLHLSLRNQLIEESKKNGLDISLAKIMIETTYEMAKEQFMTIIRKIVRDNSVPGFANFSFTRDEIIRQRIDYSLNKLKKDLISRLEEKEFEIKHIFDALLYRTKAIYSTEKSFAKNVSLLYIAKQFYRDIEIINDNNEICDLCKAKLTKVNYNDNLAEEKIPPHHPGCKCGVKMISEV